MCFKEEGSHIGYWEIMSKLCEGVQRLEYLDCENGIYSNSYGDFPSNVKPYNVISSTRCTPTVEIQG